MLNLEEVGHRILGSLSLEVVGLQIFLCGRLKI